MLLSLKKNTDSLFAAILGFLIILFFTRHSGIGISPDSVVYTSAAESFAQHGRLLAYDSEPLVDFPPFYPIFLGLIRLATGLHPVTSGPILNAFLFGFLIFLAGQMIERFELRSRIYKAAILSCIVLTPCLLEIYSMLWTETLFVLFILLFLASLRRYFINYSMKALLIAAIVAALASITRYAGITLIGTGAIFILFDSRIELGRKIRDLLLFSVASSSLLIFTMIRNYELSTTLTGYREVSKVSWKENLTDTGIVFSDWLPMLHGHIHWGLIVGAIFILILVLLIGLQFSQHRRMANYESMAAGFSLVYILFMITIASISRFETLDSRFFSPVFIPLLWSLSYWIPGWIRTLKKPLNIAAIILAGIIFLAFQSRQVKEDLDTWDGVKDAGIPGYTEDDWRNSNTVQFLQQDSLFKKNDHELYSDAYDAVYFFTGKSGKFLPHKEMKDELEEFMEEPRFYIVWFNEGQNSDLVGLDFITRIKGIKLIKQFDDGVIYEYYH